MYDAKVIFIKEYNPGTGVTLNKAYKIENGRLTYDNGKQSDTEFKDLEDLNRRNRAKFKTFGRGRPRKND